MYVYIYIFEGLCSKMICTPYGNIVTGIRSNGFNRESPEGK